MMPELDELEELAQLPDYRPYSYGRTRSIPAVKCAGTATRTGKRCNAQAAVGSAFCAKHRPKEMPHD